MLGFAAKAQGDVHSSASEVLSARWCAPEEAVTALREGSIAQRAVIRIKNLSA